MRSWLSPISLIWLVTHSFLVLVGMLCMTSEGERLFGVTVGQSVGSGLLTTGIAGWSLYLYVRLTEHLQQRLEVITEAGVMNVFRHRSVRIREQYDYRLRKASHVDLIGLGLSSFREDYAREFDQWSRRARVRILLIDPTFPTQAQSLADYRDLEEGGTKGKIRSDVEAFEAEISRNTNIDRKRFEVRRMRTIPAINLLRIDNEIFWGPYLMSQPSRNTPTLLIHSGGFMFDDLLQHFEATWEAAVPIA